MAALYSTFTMYVRLLVTLYSTAYYQVSRPAIPGRRHGLQQYRGLDRRLWYISPHRLHSVKSQGSVDRCAFCRRMRAQYVFVVNLASMHACKASWVYTKGPRAQLSFYGRPAIDDSILIGTIGANSSAINFHFAAFKDGAGRLWRKCTEWANHSGSHTNRVFTSAKEVANWCDMLPRVFA